MNGLLSMIGMQAEMDYQMGDFPFGLPSFRFNVPKGRDRKSTRLNSSH